MNESNLEYLKSRLLNLGFGDQLNADLEKNITAQLEKFTVPTQMEFMLREKKDIVEFNVDFSKSKESDMYFLNKFEATLKGEEPSKDRSHTFYIDKGNGYTAKESFNLLEGRAVHKNLNDKEGNPYQAWVQFDLSNKDDKGNYPVNKYHTNYGFDLEKVLEKHPIKELTDPVHKERLVKSLERGNVQSVTFQKESQETKMFVEANPKMKNLVVYNDQMVKQFQGERKEKGVKQTDGEATTKQNDQKNLKEEPPAEEKKKRKGMSV